MTTQRTFTAEEAQKKFDALPPEVQELMYSPELTTTIQKIGEKNKLHYDQMGRLEMEVHNVMLGFTATQDFVTILMKGLELDQAKAEVIVQDVNDMLFSKIRDAMKKVYEQHAPEPMVVGDNADKGMSVVMPSKAAVPPTSTPVATALATVNPTTPVPKVPEIAPRADIMLTEPTVSLPVTPAAPQPAATTPDTTATNKSEPPKPAPYKADPYREPLE